MIKYDPSILQSVTAARIVELVLKLHKELREYHKQKMEMLKDDPNYAKSNIVDVTSFNNLNSDVKRLKNDHHKALNSLRDFRGKIHSEQLKYMDSGARRERYKTTN